MRSEHPSMREALRAWVLAKAAHLRPEELRDDTALFERRHLRSIHVPELLLLLERLAGTAVDVEDLRPEDFRDIDALMRRFGRLEPVR